MTKEANLAVDFPSIMHINECHYNLFIIAKGYKLSERNIFINTFFIIKEKLVYCQKWISFITALDQHILAVYFASSDYYWP